MGFAASVRNAFSRNAFIGAAATFAATLPFSHADAQAARTVPTNSRPGVTAPVATARNTNRSPYDAVDSANAYSRDGKGVGVLIILSDSVLAKGVTGEGVGKPIVDSLSARGVPAKYFFERSRVGLSGITVVMNAMPYRNAQGVGGFTPKTIRAEFDNIRDRYNATQRRAISPPRRD